MEAIKKEAPQIHEGVERNINVTRHIEWGDVEEAFEQLGLYTRRLVQVFGPGAHVYGDSLRGGRIHA